jgi:hypothetical protein
LHARCYTTTPTCRAWIQRAGRAYFPALTFAGVSWFRTVVDGFGCLRYRLNAGIARLLIMLPRARATNCCLLSLDSARAPTILILVLGRSVPHIVRFVPKSAAPLPGCFVWTCRGLISWAEIETGRLGSSRLLGPQLATRHERLSREARGFDWGGCSPVRYWLFNLGGSLPSIGVWPLVLPSRVHFSWQSCW